jgi:Spy/CpxP family protein refolding chaperone
MCCTSSWSAHCRPFGFIPFRHHRRHRHEPGPGGWGWGGYGFSARGGGGPESEGFGGFGGGGPFGVRRPLRFLAHKLGLDDKQIAELARILDELKTERAQAEVDDHRTLGEFADALGGDAFDTGKAASAGDRRVASAGKLRDAVVRALGQIHAMLNPEQRARLAYLIRTGTLSV